ncbi:MAG: T9SS type A sorting domain-containing protein [Flavobacterium sp.]|nr:T9SS type A sorting domain-containing protein [Flavobacterium sp.]
MKRVYLFLGLCLAGYKPATAQYGSCTTVDYIKAPSTVHMSSSTDGFGGVATAISADGNTMAVGNVHDQNPGSGVNPAFGGASVSVAGGVYVYTRADSLSPWVYQAYIKAQIVRNFDRFGASLALSADGSTLAVGAKWEDGSGTGINPGSDALATNAGAVYMYTRSGSTWSFTHYIKASNAENYDQFGFSVSLSGDGNTLAVGAIGETGSGRGINPDDNNDYYEAGAVYIYTRSGSTWSFSTYIKASNTGGGDQFGWAVALSGDGNTLAVGALYESGSGKNINKTSDEDATASGAVYTYTRSGSTWSADAYIKASNTGSGDQFGWVVSLSSDGTTLAVGALSEKGSGTGINPTDNDDISNAGAVYIYTRSGSTWSDGTYIKASNTGTGDAFGVSVSLSGDGNTLAVGAYGEDGSGRGINPTSDESFTNSGAAYLFKRSSGTWAQHAYIKAPIPVGGEYFGRGISLSANGANLLVGAPSDRSNGTGVNPEKNNSGTDYGALWVYNQYGATIPRVTFDGIVSKANVCTDPLYINLKDTSDITGRRNIARIFPNGNSFTVDSAFVNASSAGVHLATMVGVQSTQLLRRMFTIKTTPATGLTVNGGPIVRLYYDTSETKAQIPVGTYPIQNWFKHAGNKDSILADLVYNDINNSTNLTPVASGFEGKDAYVDLQATSFNTITFGALGSTAALLPLDLRQFDAKPNANCGVDISWTTANEQNIHRFVVQGSSNGSNWEDKGVVKPGTSAQQQYQYQDGLGQTGTYYYRLMYEENDGKKMYSHAVALRLNCAANSPKVFPTITQDRVNIWLPESYADAQIMVFNLVGQRQNIEQTSNGSYRVLQLNALAQGSYIVRIVQKDGNAVHLKVIKQ